jgi:RNA polymerase sigma factor (sigma-70 family)
MNYSELFNRLLPKMNQLARKYRQYCSMVDADDLVSEMALHLWEKYQTGAYADKTDSYIVQSCYFHLRNYLRNMQDRQKLCALNETGTDGDYDDGSSHLALEETIPDGADLPQVVVEGRALYEKIMSNGLSRREKEIISFLYDGMTVREIGRTLRLSHTMVVRYKKNIAEKVSRNYANLLV